MEEGNTVYNSREGCNAIIKTIENELIAGCKNTTIPSSVTIIGYAAFEGCELTSVTIPNSVTRIGVHAFDCSSRLTTITIPNSVISIEEGAFSYCYNLTSVTVLRETPVVITENVFTYRANATLYVPAGCKAAYEAADYWKEFKEIVEMEEEIVATDITQMDNIVYADNLQAYVGARKELSFKMKNSAPIRGFQFDVVLPEGVTPATYANGTIICALLQGRRAEGDQHTVTVTRQEDGSYRVLCGSLANDVFTGSDGEVMTLTVDVADDMATGSFPVVLKNIKLTETIITNKYETEEVVVGLTVDEDKPGDFSGDGVVDVSDYIGVANYILGTRTGNQNVKAADVDGSGSIDVSDYIGVANIILTGSVNGNAAATRSARQEETDGKEPQ